MKTYSNYIGFWKRAWMALIDLTLLLLYETIIIISPSLPWKYDYLTLIFNYTLLFIIPIIFVITCWYIWGATPGKMLGKSIVIDLKTNKKPKLGKLILRYFSYTVSSLLFFIGFILSAFDSKKQGWHDKIAGTAVVNREKINPIDSINSSRRDKVYFAIYSSLFCLLVVSILTIAILGICDEKLNPDIAELENEQIEDLDPETNAFYYWAGFASHPDSSSFNMGLKFAELMREQGYSKSLNLNGIPLPNLSDTFTDVIVNLNPITDQDSNIDSLYEKSNVYNRRFDELKNYTTYIRPYPIHYTNGMQVPLSLMNYYRLRLLHNAKSYLSGDKTALLKIQGDHKLIRKMLTKSNAHFMKIIFTLMEDQTLKTYNYLIEFSPSVEEDLQKAVIELVNLTKDERSSKSILNNEFIMHFRSARLNKHNINLLRFNATLGALIFKLIPNDRSLETDSEILQEMADQVLNYALFSQISFIDIIKILTINQNEIKNHSYEGLLEAIELSEFPANEYNNYSISNEAYSSDIDDIESFSILTDHLIRTDWRYLLSAYPVYHDFGGYITLLKLKLKIRNEKIDADNISEFLISQKDTHFNPYTKEAILWDKKNSSLYFEGPEENGYDLRNIKVYN